MVKKTYLEKATLADASSRWFDALEQAGCFDTASETIPTLDAFEHITANPIKAQRAVPHVRTSAMDGIAVRAAETVEARIDRPLVLKRAKDFVQVDTGDPLPENCDSVIMVEDLDFLDENTVEIRKASFPGQHIRPLGEDFEEAATVIDAHRILDPEAIAASLASGNATVNVIKAPRVLVIPTGSELTDPLGKMPPEKYPETNSALFRGYLTRWKAESTIHPLIEDNEALIKDAVAKGLDDHDMILINAGTSKGREDFTTPIIEAFGEVLVHGVSMHPGHPVVLGIIQNKPVIGVPGYPVATWVTLTQFVLPFLEKYYGCKLQPRHLVKAKLAKKVYSSLGEIEFIRIRLEDTEDGKIVHQITGKASALSSLIKADGILQVPEAVSGYPQGEAVDILLL